MQDPGCILIYVGVIFLFKKKKQKTVFFFKTIKYEAI